jgi:hypothetical protein
VPSFLRAANICVCARRCCEQLIARAACNYIFNPRSGLMYESARKQNNYTRIYALSFSLTCVLEREREFCGILFTQRAQKAASNIPTGCKRERNSERQREKTPALQQPMRR